MCHSSRWTALPSFGKKDSPLIPICRYLFFMAGNVKKKKVVLHFDMVPTHS